MSLQSDFEAKFPSLTPLNQEIFDSAVDTYPCIYGAVYCETGCTQVQLCDNQIILYLVAHLYVIDLRAESAGSGGSSPINNVASKSVGDESISFQYGADMSNNALFFSTTRYGQRYLILTQKNLGAVFV
jgi:hypothetical protein